MPFQPFHCEMTSLNQIPHSEMNDVLFFFFLLGYVIHHETTEYGGPFASPNPKNGEVFDSFRRLPSLSS